MATGFSTVNVANAFLNHLTGGTAWTQPAGRYAVMHIGDPGPSGTANPSVVTTRSSITYAAAAAGAVAITGTNPSFAMTASETLTHISVWSASSGGNFLWSAQLSASKAVGAGDTYTLTSVGVAQTPLAA